MILDCSKSLALPLDRCARTYSTITLLLGAKPWLGVYSASIVFAPKTSLGVLSVALPRRRASVPRLNAPSRKVTDPLGVLPPRLRSLTVAVKVTGRRGSPVWARCQDGSRGGNWSSRTRGADGHSHRVGAAGSEGGIAAVRGGDGVGAGHQRRRREACLIQPCHFSQAYGGLCLAVDRAGD